MRFPAAGTSIVSSALCALLAWPSLAGAATAAAPGDRQVLLVAAADSYADLKKQLAWIGTQTDNPGLAAMFESLFMLATRGAGLAGLDVRRPLGIVVTGDGEDVGVHGFVPVKSLDKLLASLQGITGPVEKDGNAYRVTLPSGLPLTISEREGWAVITPTTADGRATPVVGDPAALLGSVAKEYTIGIEAFPSRMSDAVRRRLEEGLDLAAAESAARGQPMDPAALKALLGNLRQTESFAVGLAIDDASGAVFVENRSVGIPGSVSAAASAAAAKGTLTVGMPPPAKGERPAMRGYIAQAIPEEARDQFLAALDQSLPREADDPVTRTVSRLVYDMLAAALGAGGIDAALAVDTSQATAERPVPAVTAGVRVKDGAQLEQRVKQLFGAGGGLAGVRATFDAGKAGDANLHRIAIDVADDALAERLGRSLELTLAVAPNYALVLAGADAAARATATIAASGRPVADAVPVADLQAFAAPLLRYADMLAAEGPAAKGADAAGDAGGGVVALRVRPIDRGLATRLSIDSGVLKALAAMTSPERPVGPGGVPLPEVPPGFPLPVPLPR